MAGSIDTQLQSETDPAEGERRKRQEEQLAEARRILRRYIPESYSLVDEFLAERRAMWGEED